MSNLHDLVRAGNGIGRLRELLAAGENPNIRNNEGDAPLHFIASKNEINPQDLEENLQVARELIRFGAIVDLRNNMGRTPLIIAVNFRNCGMIEFLLRADAQINEKDSNGNTALHHATSQCGSSFHSRGDVIRHPVLQVVKTLLRFHPELNIQNIVNQTPLMLAVKNQDIRIVQELLKQNASVNLKDAYNQSAMHHALDHADVNVDIIIELIRHGCEFCIRDLYNETPMTLYIRKLLIAPMAQLEKSKYVFKLFLFGKNSFNLPESDAIERISTEKNCQLSQFIGYCKTETSHMLLDELAPNYYVYNLAWRGFSCRSAENNHVSFDVFDKALDKLMEGQYPVYCDMIVSGICSPYLNNKFAEICCSVRNTGIDFLTFDELYSLSFYLSHLDMLNMMIACSPDNRCHTPFSRLRQFQRYTNCSVF